MALLTRRRLARAALLAFVMAAVAGADRAAAQVAEEDVKAAFIYNFARFTQWPDARSGPFVVGVVGRSAVQAALAAIARGRPIAGREVIVREVARDDDPRWFQIIFIPASEERRTADILAGVARAPVLTVGESPAFLRNGGVVELFIRESRVRFRINAEAATRAGLRINSQLLSLAREEDGR